MDRHLVMAFTSLATIAILSGSCSNASNDKSLGDSIGDATLTVSVRVGLAFEHGVRGSDITVRTDHRIVTLTGKVGSEAERRLAARIAGETEGVREVVNLLEVRG